MLEARGWPNLPDWPQLLCGDFELPGSSPANPCVTAGKAAIALSGNLALGRGPTGDSHPSSWAYTVEFMVIFREIGPARGRTRRVWYFTFLL